MRLLEPTVLAALYRQHAPALRLFARQWGGGGDDLVQEAFVQLAQQAPPPDRALPWLYRVVRNGALSDLRAAGRRRRREQRASAPETWFAPDADDLTGGEAALLLGQLPLEMREVVVAHLWGGLTFDDIARLVGCSAPTAHRRYRAGLERLRERLEGPCTPKPTAPKT